MRIAVLDDEKTQLQLIEQALIGGDNQWGEDVDVQFFSSGEAMLQTAKREFFDCYLLDRLVGDMSGDVILQWLRQYGEKTHGDYSIVIMLTSLRAEGEVVSSLALGANDYMVKPFRPAELVVRIKRALETKRTLSHKSIAAPVEHAEDMDCDVVSLYGYEFESFSNTVTFKGKSVTLTGREFALALLLFRNAGRAVSRPSIFEVVWRRIDGGSNRTLDTHIYRVRHSLKLNAENGISIKPVYGYGYRLDVLGRTAALDETNGVDKKDAKQA